MFITPDTEPAEVPPRSEVTAQNEGAIRLYRRLGFRRRKTVYKAVMAQAGAW